MITTILTWNDFRSMTFAKIAQLINDANCSTYTILGYNFLDIKLILHYRDCDWVYEFTFNQIGPEYVNEDLNKQFEVTSYYTKDYTFDEYIAQQNEFSENFNKRKKE